MLVTSLIALGWMILRLLRRSGNPAAMTLVVAGLGAACGALLFFRVLVSPPAPHAVVDVKLGGVLGLLSALGIALGGFEALRWERMQRKPNGGQAAP
jgi:hypothetical protein